MLIRAEKSSAIACNQVTSDLRVDSKSLILNRVRPLMFTNNGALSVTSFGGSFAFFSGPMA